MLVIAKGTFFLAVFFILLSENAATGESRCKSVGVWTWVCQEEKCEKMEAGSSPVIEINTCKLTCGKYSMLWPKPSGSTVISDDTVPFLPEKMKLLSIQCGMAACPLDIEQLLNDAFNLFQKTMMSTYLTISQKKKERPSFFCVEEAHQREVEVSIVLATTESRLTLSTEESYSMKITSDDKVITVEIEAQNFFGARHALETTSQLTAFKDSHHSLQIVSRASIIDDKPSYPYRGILLDTSRNYFSVDSIIRLITAMSYNKMNTLHWHITDTHSFPIEIPSEPRLSQYGAYSAERIYSHDDVKRIVSHALISGIRILPEFDVPAHCGEGWQWGPAQGYGNLTVCFRKEPWQNYCVEPPCGQLNPTNDRMYEILGKIYKTYFELFNPDLFHAGGDEININCWNTTEEITNWMEENYKGVQEINFMDLWGLFIEKSSTKIIEANGNQDIPLILWTSEMTSPKYITRYLDPSKHILQIWTQRKDNQIPDIVRKGFQTIFSTYDTLYLDCGYGNWVSEGNNWCSPYKDWKALYLNDPVKILTRLNVTVTESIRKNILGQEAAMWSEQVDEYSSESKIWPRTSALAERLWSDAGNGWRAAEHRLVFHRERLVERGVYADVLQPLWCEQNAGHCYFNPSIKGDKRYMI